MWGKITHTFIIRKTFVYYLSFSRVKHKPRTGFTGNRRHRRGSLASSPPTSVHATCKTGEGDMPAAIATLEREARESKKRDSRSGKGRRSKHKRHVSKNQRQRTQKLRGHERKSRHSPIQLQDHRHESRQTSRRKGGQSNDGPQQISNLIAREMDRRVKTERMTCRHAAQTTSTL